MDVSLLLQIVIHSPLARHVVHDSIMHLFECAIKPLDIYEECFSC